MSTDNYKNFLGGNYAIDTPLNKNPGSDTYIDLLEVHAPISGIGRGSNITIGRYAHRVSRLKLRVATDVANHSHRSSLVHRRFDFLRQRNIFDDEFG